MSATPQDVLREAAQRLMRFGWWDGTPGSHPLVAECALLSITHQEPSGAVVVREAVDLLCEYLSLKEPSEPVANWANLTRWNDAPERTAEDVILALKRAAEES